MATLARRPGAGRRGLTLVLATTLATPLPVGAATPAPVVTCGTLAAAPPVDNRDGYFVNLEEAPLRPLALGSDGHTLFALNIPDARVVVFDVSNALAPRLVGDVGVGLGPVSIVLRPGLDGDPRELWVACQSSNAVFVIDEASRRVKDVVRLVGEPTGIAFDSTGAFAYVTLAAVDEIAKLDASNPQAPPTKIQFASLTRPGVTQLAHVPEPRALFMEGQDLYVLSFQSGNGSYPATFDILNPPILDGWQANAFFPTVVPLPPDRDVLRFNPSTPGAPGINALWRMGTLNFDVLRGGPANDVYVSTVDFSNATLDVGTPPGGIKVLDSEADYRKQGFVTHAIRHAQPGSGAPSPAQSIDLNVDVVPALTAAGYRCAVPNQMALSPDGGRLYVACYETQNAAVVDLNTRQVIAELRGGSSTTDPFGARGLLLNGTALYLYQRGDHTLQTFNVANVTPGTVRLPVPNTARPIGFDVTSRTVLNGRRHFLNAANSASGLATCNTCHMDGHLDGIGWNLSDATGAEDALPRVPKGTKVTMSLRGIEETPPFHWRGDRADLSNFNPAFEGLLGGAPLAQTPDPSDDDALAEFEAFVFSLSYPANPHLADDRDSSGDAKLGFHCFDQHPTHVVSKNTDGLAGLPAGQISVSCAECHSMAGASGTLNQVNNPATFLLADDATQLRGLWDKESEPISFASSTPPTFLSTLPASGWGFGNSGFTFSIQNFVDLPVFAFPAGMKPKVTQFLREMDTGLAPATAFAYRVTAGATAQETLLTSQANARHADLIVRGTVQIGLLAHVPVGGQWDGTAFLLDRSSPPLTQLTLTDLHNHVQNGTGQFTLIGTPVGMGYRLGRDRDMDFRLDADEALAPATSPTNPDSDGDTFPDGYEVRLGSNPTLASSTPVDNLAPNVSSSTIAWRNSNVMKVRWTTDEESRSRLQIYRVPGGGLPLQFVREFRERQFKKEHVLVARGLRPGDTYRGVIVTEDPRGNSANLQLADKTLQDQLFPAGFVQSTHLRHLGPSPSGVTQRYRATFTLVNEDGAPLPNASVDFKLVEWLDACTGAGCNTETNLCTHASGCTLPATSDPAGRLTVTFDGVAGSLSAATAEVFVTNLVDPGKRLYFHSLDGQFGHWARVAVP